MQNYGIDGIALQRFVSELDGGKGEKNRNGIATKVKKAAESYGRIFYIMYDISGARPETFVEIIKRDWENTVKKDLNLISSPQYAKQDGKPVVGIWGIGFKDRPGVAWQFKELFNWFKKQGYYVVGGVPITWRTGGGDAKENFADVYKALDMISLGRLDVTKQTMKSITTKKSF